MSKSKKTAKSGATEKRGGESGSRKAPASTKAARSTKNSQPGVRENSKLATVVAMLRSPKGATIEQLSKATGWQTHSVRGAISGAIKRKLALAVTSVKTDGVRTYRITA